MTKATYKDRVKNLFSEIEPADPRASQPSPGISPAGDPMQPEPGGGNAPHDVNPLHPNLAVEPSGSPEEVIFGPISLGSQADSLLFPDQNVESGSAEPGSSGWANYLDGIHRSEQLSYDFKTGQETEPKLPRPDKKQQVPIIISGEEVGKLVVDVPDEAQWSEDHHDLIATVAQQLAQKIETLRLLEQAQESRNVAEDAFHRIASQPGSAVPGEQMPDHYLAPLDYQPVNSPQDNKVLEKNLVSINSTEVEPGKSVVATSIQIGSHFTGQLELAKDSLSPEEAELIKAVTERLAQQVDNLQLLDESQHFREKTEEAIRQLTYQSWQNYLASTAKAGLGFSYDRLRVSKLNLDDLLQGSVFPLYVREEAIGQLAIESPLANQTDIKDLINVITERLSTHLESLRLAEQREQALSETETLYGVSAQLSTSQSIEEALQSVSESARRSGARTSRLYFVDLDELGLVEGLSLAAIWRLGSGSQATAGSSSFRLIDNPAYWQLLKDPNNPLFVDNVTTDPYLDRQVRKLFLEAGAQAAAILPLSINSRWVGVITIHWAEPHTFSEQEARLYASLSRQAAVVVNNRMLLEQTRKRAQELQTVARVSTAASTILDPRELLQSVVNLTKASFDLYHVQVYTYFDDGNYFEIAAGSGEIGEKLLDLGSYIKADSLAVVARAGSQRKGIVVHDAQAEPGFSLNNFLPDVRSEIAIPMIVGDRLLGVFNVQASTKNRFSRDDVRTFSTLASQIAVALQNAELYAEQTATVQRLRELDHLKSAFLANMSHELRTPLNSILGFAEVLLLGLDGPLNETMVNDVNLIEKNGKHLLSLINDVLDMAKIEAGKMNLVFEKFFLRELMEEALDITSSLAREKDLILKIMPDSQDVFAISADRVRLRQVFINIISNAVKFTEKGGVFIKTVRFPDEQKLRISFQDTGIGIPNTMLEAIFESFSQVDTSTTRKAGGTGLGLPISRRLIQLHGGQMWAESNGVYGDGSTFFVELPFEAHKPAD